MKEQLTKLISVKSVVTIILTAVFAYLAIVGSVTAQDVMTVFMVVITFYFAKDKERAALAAPAEQEEASEK